MTTPQRLLDDPNADTDEVAILRSAKSDVMSDDAREKILTGIGLGGATLGLTASISSVAKNAWPWGKVGALLVGAGVIATSLALLYSPSNETPEAPPVAAPQSGPERLSGTSRPVTPRAAEMPTSEVRNDKARESDEARTEEHHGELAELVRSAPESRLEKAIEKPSGRSRSLEKPALAAELAALKAAESNLASGDASSALKLVGDYRSAFPDGRLSQEATMLEIEALVSLGQRERAERLAGPLLKGQSLYAARIRSLLGKRAP